MTKVWAVHHSKIIPGEAIFKLHDERGIPLEICCILANERGLVIDWSGFIKRVKETGNFNIERLLNRIRIASRDSGYNDAWWEKQCLEDPDNFKKG